MTGSDNPGTARITLVRIGKPMKLSGFDSCLGNEAPSQDHMPEDSKKSCCQEKNSGIQNPWR